MNLSNLLSPTAQATLLLTSYFSKASDESVKPLTNKEWGKFALWLRDKGLSPKDLLSTDSKNLLEGWSDNKISLERIVQLLSRGHSLALAMEKWHRAGLWVVTRSDAEYPKRLKQRLRMDCPPVLFGCGDKSLLNVDGLAVIGSRNADQRDLSFTQQVGAIAASEGVAIVSGGARGVDETAMLGAANGGGVVIGILADSLLRAATSSKWRAGLMNNNVVLVSPFYPEAGFFAGNAMARNKYIYCLADSALVIHSGKKGGTLSGAEENLKKGWVPLWVKPTDDKSAANADLVAKGGKWINEKIDSLSVAELLKRADLTNDTSEKSSEKLQPLSNSSQADLFAEEKTESISVSEPEVGSELKQSTDVASKGEVPEPKKVESSNAGAVKEQEESQIDFYQMFLKEIKRSPKQAVTTDYLVERLSLHKSQINEWLKRGVSERKLRKLSKPVRYVVVEDE